MQRKKEIKRKINPMIFHVLSSRAISLRLIFSSFSGVRSDLVFRGLSTGFEVDLPFSFLAIKTKIMRRFLSFTIKVFNISTIFCQKIKLLQAIVIFERLRRMTHSLFKRTKTYHFKKAQLLFIAFLFIS